MIKVTVYISLLLSIQFFYGCNSENESGIDVNRLVKNHQLVPEDAFDFVQRDSLKIAVYSNKETDKALLVLKDDKNDTVVKYFGNGIANICMFRLEAKDNNLYLFIPKSGKTLYNKTKFGRTPIDLKQFKKDEIYLDSLQCYQILPANKELKKINRISNDSLINLSKHKFLLDGNIKMVDAPTLRSFTIAKDTLNGSENRFLIITDKYVVKQDQNEFLLSPLNLRLNKVGLYKDDITVHSDYVGSTLLDTISSYGSSINRFNIYEKTHLKFIGNTESHELVKKGIWVNDLIDDTEKLMLNIPKDFSSLDINMTLDKNVSVMVEIKPILFKYRNGHYFISLFFPYPDEYPRLYHLDTLQWKMSPLLPYDSNVDNNYTLLGRTKHIELVSEDVRKRVSNFLNKYEIIRVGNEFRLKQKM